MGGLTNCKAQRGQFGHFEKILSDAHHIKGIYGRTNGQNGHVYMCVSYK
jgi:hypothetical protein